MIINITIKILPNRYSQYFAKIHHISKHIIGKKIDNKYCNKKIYLGIPKILPKYTIFQNTLLNIVCCWILLKKMQ